MIIRAPEAMRFLWLAVAIMIGFIFVACGIRKPQAPSWESDWDFTIIDRRLGIQEIIGSFDSTNVIFDTLSNPRIEITQSLDTVTLDEILRLQSADLVMKDSLGLIEIDPPPDIAMSALLTSFLDVDTGFVPPVGFEFPEFLPPFDNFTWADVQNGQMSLTVQNLLEVDLDTLVISVVDSADFHTVAIFAFSNGVSYLETETETADFSRQTISNSLIFWYHGHTPGGVLINAGDQRLETSLTFRDGITVSAAMAQTPQITRAKSGRYEIEDSTRIYSSTISDGTISFDIYNDTELPFLVHVHTPNFAINGSELSLWQQISPRNSMQLALDLGGYAFVPDDDSPFQAVNIDMVNSVAPSAPDQYTFRASDSLRVIIHVSDIRFSEIDGRLKPSTAQIYPVTRYIDLPGGMDEVRLTQGSLSITIMNNSDLPADLTLSITGGGKMIPLSGRISARSSPQEPPALTTFFATQEQTNYFFDPPPDAMVIGGTGVLNPDYDAAVLRVGDSFTGEVVFNSVFAMAIPETVTIESRTTGIDVAGARPDGFQQAATQGAITATLENHLPIGTQIRLFIGTARDSTVFTDPASLILGPFVVQKGETGPDGTVIVPVTSVMNDTISNLQMLIFDNDSLFIGQQIDLLPTDSTGVLFQGDDYIDVRAVARIRLRMGGE